MAVNLKHLRAAPICRANSHQLEKLVNVQAEHHGCKCAEGSFSRLKEAIDNGTNGVGGFFIYAEGHEEPLAYVVHSPIISAHGKGLYMEDICVLEKARGLGIGHFAMDELAGSAIRANCDFVSWVVADNNGIGLNFYGSLGAHEEHTEGYFMETSSLVQSGARYERTTRQLNEGDRMALMQFCVANGYSARFASFEGCYRMAASFNASGQIEAVSLGSANQSTFRGVQGLEISETLYSKELLNDDARRAEAFEDLVNRNIAMAHESGLTGHMIWGIAKDDRALAGAMTGRFKGELLSMTDEPESKLSGRYLDRAQLGRMAVRHNEMLPFLQFQAYSGKMRLPRRLRLTDREAAVNIGTARSYANAIV